MNLPWNRPDKGLQDRLEAIEKDIRALQSGERRPYDDRAVLAAIEDLDERLRDQTMAIAEGIERVDRSERRVHAAVQRAKRRMDEAGIEDPGIEAEAAQLQFDYAGGGGAEGVPPVQHHVEQAYDLDFPEESLPGGWTAEDRALLANRRR